MTEGEIVWEEETNVISSDETETDDVLTMVLEDDGEGSILVVVLDDMKTIVDVEDDITIKLY